MLRRLIASFPGLKLAAGLCILFAQPSAAQAPNRQVGTYVSGMPGAIWVDQDSDGNADGYLLNGRIFADPPAAAPAPTLPPGGTQVDPQWGLLVDMAERDFVAKGMLNEAVIAVRWEIPGRKLTMSQWGGSHNITSFEFNPETRQLTGKLFGEASPASIVHIGSDGSISIDEYGTQVPLIRKQADGFWFRYNSVNKVIFRPLSSTDPASSRMAALIAQGKERAADPSRFTTQALASSSPPTVHQQPLVVSSAMSAAPIGPRLALIIGNSAYAASMGALPNPANDAGAMARALGALGFNVTLVKNADQKSMKRAISDFGQRLAKAGPGSTGLFFYAGHGIQAKGINYLIPTDANIQTQADVDLEAVGADTILEQMEEAGAATNIVILDACRNMPLVRGFRSPTRGLAPMDAPNGSFIAYSTAPGSVAADGLGANSPFVTALVKNLGRKGESIESIFRDVRREVLTQTEGTQTPWDSSSLIQPFYFAGR